MKNYYKKPGLFGGFSLFPPILKILLVVNAVVFILQWLFFPLLYVGANNLNELFMHYFALQPFGHGFLPWQIFTYMFMHGDFMHILLNMFILWMFGVELENLWGSKKFLIYYLMCGIAAAAANLVIAPFVTSVGPTVGASGAIYGILAAFAFLFPNRPIYIYFFIPVKAKYMILLYMFFDLMSIVTNSSTGIAHVAHLGGAVAGFIYLFITSRNKNPFANYHKPEDTLSSWRKKASSFTPFKKSNGSYQSNTKTKEAVYHDVDVAEIDHEDENEQQLAQQKIDAILDKLSEGGYGSLTEEEKRILFQESKKLR